MTAMLDTLRCVRSEEIVIARDGRAAEADVLKAWERCRREVALLLSGQDRSVFLGYDELDLGPDLAYAGDVLVSAVVAENRGHRHAVEYQAVVLSRVLADDGSYRALENGSLVARGAGWTSLASC